MARDASGQGGGGALPGCPITNGTTTWFWSDYFAPGNTHYDSTNKIATIDAGHKVYLDVSPTEVMAVLHVKGALVFDHCYDGLVLSASSILIDNGGVIQAGASTWEFPYEATIELADWPGGTPVTDLPTTVTTQPEYKAALLDRGLVVADGGTLRLFGRSHEASWTRLNATASAGSSQITVENLLLDWPIGSRFVIASTDFDPLQAETHLIGSIGSNNGVISFQGGTTLLRSHWGTKQWFTPPGGTPSAWEVDERAEVGLLSRNVRVVGVQSTDPNAGPETFGHVFIHDHDTADSVHPRALLSWVEFRDLGIAGKESRYPLHFHELGDPGTANKSYARSCAVWKGHNRGIVVHASSKVELDQNVVYDVIGHGVYVEDFMSTGNTITGNLSLVNRKYEPSGILAFQDATPSNFSLRSLDNVFEGNVAAGSRDYGIYLNLYLGEFAAPLGMSFEGNVAHSIGRIGVFQDVSISNTTPLTLSDTRIWKCREYGLWFRSLGEYLVNGLIAADCRAGFYPASRGLRRPGEGRQILTDALFVGETSNVGDPATWNGPETYAQRSLPQNTPNFPNHELKWDTLCGIEVYDGFLEVSQCRFAAFADLDLSPTDPADYRWGAGLTQVSKYTTWSNDPRNTVRDLDFAPSVTRTVYFRPPPDGQNQVAFTLIYDEDGTTEHGGSVVLFPNTPFLAAFQNGAGYNSSLNGYVVPAGAVDHGLIALEIDGEDDPLSGAERTMWRRIGLVNGLEVAGAAWQADSIPVDVSVGGQGEFAFPVTVEVGSQNPSILYEVEYPDHPGGTLPYPADLTIQYRFAPTEGRVVFLRIPYDNGSGPSGNPTTVGWFQTAIDFLPVFQEANLTAVFTSSSSKKLAWYHDVAASMLYLKLTSHKMPQHSLYPDGTEFQVRVIQ